MTRPAPTNAASLAARLRNLCRERAIPEGRALRLLGVVVVGQLLARTGVGVVKGATNVEVRVAGSSASPSSQPSRHVQDPADRATHAGSALVWRGAGAVLTTLQTKSANPTWSVAMAFPDFPTYRRLVAGTEPALRSIEIDVFFVESDGTLSSA